MQGFAAATADNGETLGLIWLRRRAKHAYVAAGLATFISFYVSPLLLAVVGRIDLITIWITVLVAIGLAVTGRIPLRKAAIAAAIVWFVGGLPLILPALRSM